MTRTRAMRIHAFHDASAQLTIYLTVAAFALALAMGRTLADSLALGAAALAFFAIMASVATDMMSKRIPNSLSLMTLAAAPIWWLAQALGVDGSGAGNGIARTLLANFDPIYGQGALLPAFPFGLEFPASVISDIIGMVLVFLPLLASFYFRLGFGGGDVKLIAAGSLYFGWPLGADFLAMSFIIGGIFSVFVVLGRIFCRIALRFGAESERARRYAQLREFPYAPAIAISAILCLACKLEGLI